MIVSYKLPVCGKTRIASAPADAIRVMVRDASSNQAGFGFTPNSTTELQSTSATASSIRSASAVVRTYVLLKEDLLLMMKVRTSSPALAGRKLLPRYPA